MICRAADGAWPLPDSTEAAGESGILGAVRCRPIRATARLASGAWSLRRSVLYRDLKSGRLAILNSGGELDVIGCSRKSRAAPAPFPPDGPSFAPRTVA